MRRLGSFALGLFLAGCEGPVTIAVDGHDSADPGSSRDSGSSVLPGDTSETGDTSDTAEEESPEEEAAWQAGFFDNAVIHEVNIELDDGAMHQLRLDGYTYVEGNVTVDGERRDSVGVRLRGKIGSFRTIDQKPKFKIDFSQYVAGQRLHGLHSMALNNEVVDCSYLKEPIGYEVFRQLGIPGARTSFSRVSVNGENYGLYVVVEVPDAELLKLRLPDDDEGNLYDGKYLYNTVTHAYTLLDFASGEDDLFPLEEGTEEGNASIHAISNGMAGAPNGAGFGAAMDPLVDWTEWHNAWAAEEWVGHLDGYLMNKNNYRVYFRPSDGRMMYLPTDFDYAFLTDGSWGVGWTGPIGTLGSRCYADPSCLAAQSAAVNASLGVIDAPGLDAMLTEMQALIHDDAADDPRRECGTRSVWTGQDDLHSWIAGRAERVQARWPQ